MDTANIVGRELKIGRDRLVPELNFMDPRAVGKWDMLPLSTTEVAVLAMDADEAGAQGRGGKPPPNEDGTPHETLADQSVRLRQLLSVLETQYSGDSILLIFPDSTGPALLSALIAGVPLNCVHELDFKPGEIRLDVTMDSTMAFLTSNVNREEYNAAIANGRKELKRLREMKPDDVISVKDQKLEKERLEMEATARRREEKRLAKDQAGRLAREAQDRQVKEARQQNRDENGDESQEVATALILGVVVVGAAIALTGSNNDEKETTTPSDKAFPELPTNGTEMETQDISMDVNILNRPLIATNGDDDEQTMISTGVNGDRRASFPPSNTATDPVKKAKQAMKEYTESDDGGNAWLQVMSDLMMEDDEPELDDPDSR